MCSPEQLFLKILMDVLRKKCFYGSLDVGKAGLNQVKQVLFSVTVSDLILALSTSKKGAVRYRGMCVCAGVGSVQYFMNMLEKFFEGECKAWYPADDFLRLADLASEDHHVVIWCRGSRPWWWWWWIHIMLDHPFLKTPPQVSFIVPSFFLHYCWRSVSYPSGMLHGKTER